MAVKAYFRGGKGIENPVDFHGTEIQVGDKLSWDFHDDYYEKNGVEDWMKKDIFIVQKNEEKGFFFATGIYKELYLHDFRFKHCEIIK